MKKKYDKFLDELEAKGEGDNIHEAFMCIVIKLLKKIEKNTRK